MKEMTSRILLGVIGIPLLLALLLLPLPFNALLNGVICLFLALGSLEAVRLFEAKSLRLNRGAAVISSVLPAAATVIFCHLPNTAAALICGAVLILWFPLLLGREAFSRTSESWRTALFRSAGYGFIFLYLGGLGAAFVSFQFLSFIIQEENAGLIYLIYLIMIFTNDTMAYFIGMAVGRYTPHPAPVSPQKSLAGFLGGGICTTAVSAGTYFILPDLFDSQIIWALLSGMILAFAGIIGDLTESALKRSAGVKDSGKLMMGRGGVLDSLDSVLYGAPFFLILLLGIHLI